MNFESQHMRAASNEMRPDRARRHRGHRPRGQCLVAARRTAGCERAVANIARVTAVLSLVAYDPRLVVTHLGRDSCRAWNAATHGRQRRVNAFGANSR